MIAEASVRLATVPVEPVRLESRGLGRIEDVAVTLTLSAMVVLPLAEIVLRRTLP